MKPYAKPFYTAQKWRKTQKAYMIQKCYICERCGRTAEIVHHKIYITPENINDVNITLNFNNLEALCRTCHQVEHNSEDPEAAGRVTAPGLKFDNNGNLIKE